jgi:hypothetical protein
MDMNSTRLPVHVLERRGMILRYAGVRFETFEKSQGHGRRNGQSSWTREVLLALVPDVILPGVPRPPADFEVSPVLHTDGSSFCLYGIKLLY